MNYDYKWYNFMYRKFETSEMSIKKIKHNTLVGGAR